MASFFYKGTKTSSKASSGGGTITAPGIGDPNVYPTQYQDPNAAYIAKESQFQWRAWVSQNKAIITDVYGRWRPQGTPNLTDEELMKLAQGGPEAEPLYQEYELFRKYESFRPMFWNYYGKEPSRDEMQRAVDVFRLPEQMASQIDYHRKSNALWLEYYGRQITKSELKSLRSGQKVELPKES